MTSNNVRILPAGEQGAVVEFGNAIDPVINSQVQAFSRWVRQQAFPGIIEVVPTYRSAMLYYNPEIIDFPGIEAMVAGGIGELRVSGGGPSRLVEIPVCYGGEFGPDLNFVAQHNGLTPTEVIAIHTSQAYLVYMLGFTPGFPYLGGMSEKIAAPRLAEPRTRIPAGSVGIAGVQTGFYPVESPGGWRLIGRTPVRAFDVNREPPFLFTAGDYLQFVAITPEEYTAMQTAVARGTYVPCIRPYHGEEVVAR